MVRALILANAAACGFNRATERGWPIAGAARRATLRRVIRSGDYPATRPGDA